MGWWSRRTLTFHCSTWSGKVVFGSLRQRNGSIGILRLRGCFAWRSRHSAHDDNSIETCSHLLPCFAQRNADIHLLLCAIDCDPHRVACPVIVHDLAEVLLVLDILAIDGDDEVTAHHDWHIAQIGALGAAVEAGSVGGASRN